MESRRLSRNSQCAALTGNLTASAFLGQGNVGETNHKFFYMRQNQYAAYFQDNWKTTSKLTLNLGLRWEAWPALHEKYNNIVGFDLSQHAVVLTQPLSYYDQLNAGFAWAATRGNRPLVVRGGYTIAYYPLPIYDQLEQMRSSIPFETEPFYEPDDSCCWPDGHGGWSLRSVPTWVAGLNTNTTDVFSGLGTGTAGLSPGNLTATFIDPHFPDTRVQDWNFTLEKKVMANTVARVAWVGNHTDDLDVFNNLNPQVGQFVWASNTSTAYPRGAGTTRPYDPLYGDLTEVGRNGYSNYTVLQLELRRLYSRRFGYQIFYVINNDIPWAALATPTPRRLSFHPLHI